VNLFGQTRFGGSFDENANFRTWGNAVWTLFRNMSGNWRSQLYEQSVSPPRCTRLQDDAGSVIVDDCGNPVSAILFHVSFQLLTMFAVLNLVVAIIINGFSWVYFVEPSEITGSLDISAKQINHFRLIWDRFDLYGSGAIAVEDLALVLAIARCCVPELFMMGTVDQLDQKQYHDYAGFGSGPGGTDQNEQERLARSKYEELVRTIAIMEKAADIQRRLAEHHVDISKGEDDICLIEAEVDNGIIRCGYGSEADIELVKVQFGTLMDVLLLKALQLGEDDVYACWGCRDPFQITFAGYGTCPLHPRNETEEAEEAREAEEKKKKRVQKNLRRAFGRSDAEVEVDEGEQLKLNKKRQLKKKIANRITRAAMG